jgi:lysophospholipase L1-like esterase
MIKKISRNIFLALTLALSFSFVQAQPFANEIATFKSQDSAAMPPKNAILFVGSSSFTKWTDIQAYFPDKKVINRGFGGSTLPDVIRYADDIIFPYQPKQVVIYCGENDLASGDDVTAGTVYQRFQQLYNIIHSKLPKANITYIAMKPSPSRRNIWGPIMAANGMIRDFLSEKDNAYYIDVYYPMLSKGTETHASYFTSDSLHMNEKGYKLWQYILEPYLVRTK